MTPSTLNVLTLLASIEFADGDRAPKLAEVRRIVASMPRAELVDAVFALCDRFSRAIEATREHVELLALTEFGMPPHTVEKLNLPTMLGSLMGLALPEVREESCCATCAFRQGSAANQCIPTVSDALECLGDGEKFMCHEGVHEGMEPTKVCRGWAQAVKLAEVAA
jgi:hypothetical protein